MLPRQVAFRVRPVEEMRIKFDERAGEFALLQPLEIQLRRAHRRKAEKERKHKPGGALAGEFAGSSEIKREPRARSGKEEEQGHVPQIDKSVLNRQRDAQFVVFKMEAPKTENHPGVKRHKHGNRYHSQPIYVAPSLTHGRIDKPFLFISAYYITRSLAIQDLNIVFSVFLPFPARRFILSGKPERGACG